MNRNRVQVLAVVLGLFLAAGGIGYGGGVKVGAHGGLSIPNIRGSQDDLRGTCTPKSMPMPGTRKPISGLKAGAFGQEDE